MSDDDIKALGFYYCPRIARVVMPVHQDGQLVYWQARGFDKQRAKYINPPVDRSRLVYKIGTGPVIALTEDILSAYKVGKVTEAWSIMGTRITDAVLAELAHQSKPVRLMLDPDGAGMKANRKGLQRLRMLGCDAQVLHVPKDPKLMSRTALHDLIFKEKHVT